MDMPLFFINYTTVLRGYARNIGQRPTSITGWGGVSPM